MNQAGKVAVRVLYLPRVVVWVSVPVAMRRGFYRGPAVIVRVVEAMEEQWRWERPRLVLTDGGRGTEV